MSHFYLVDNNHLYLYVRIIITCNSINEFIQKCHCLVNKINKVAN